jgi:two-component system sensor histidine kinase PilS (NtrC family)
VISVSAGLERRLVVLMAARLALSVVSLGIALSLDAMGGNVTVTEWRGFYATVAVAFLATVGYGLLLPHVRRQRRFAAMNIATDIAIVSALVHFSGGRDSVFTFLYVLVAVYGATLFDRAGALIAAALGALAYGAVLTAGQKGWAVWGAEPEPQAWPLLVTVWAVQASAVLLVAALSSFLAAELGRTREVLSQRTSDLHRLRDLHQRTVESLASGLLTTDPQGRVTSFNPEAVRITGVPASEAIGRELDAILPGVRERVITGLARERASQGRARFPYRNRGGQALHLGVAAYVLRDDEGSPDGHVVIFQDVSDVVEMERDLRRSERLAAVGELSAGIAHEIRNPLAAISGSIQMLSREGVDAAGGLEARRLMAIAIREADRLNHLISDFLHYARPGPRKPAPVRVEEAVAEVLELFDAARPAAMKVDRAIDPALRVRADPEQLRQVLWNLVLNAAEAMEEGGTLRISAAPSGAGPPQEAPARRRNEGTGEPAWAEIVVADDGAGIPPEALDRIFDPFFTTKRDGSGLGLAMVHRIVGDHGGGVRLESSMGSGTTVRLWLPRSEASA